MLCSICYPGSPNLLHYQQHAPEAILLKQLAAHEPSVGVSDVTPGVLYHHSVHSSYSCNAEGMTTHKPLPALYSFVCQPENASFGQATCLLWNHVGPVSQSVKLTVEQYCRGWRFPGQAKGQRRWGRGPQEEALALHRGHFKSRRGLT